VVRVVTWQIELSGAAFWVSMNRIVLAKKVTDPSMLVSLGVLLLAAAVAALLGRTPRPGAAGPTASPYARAEIFCVPWSVVTAVGMLPEVVRYGKKPTIIGDAKGIAALLQAMNRDALVPPEAMWDGQGDFRVVFDFIGADTVKDSFAADGGRLVRLSDGAWHPIDEAFRQRFSCAE
jgi:hypothetical protein